MTYVNYAAREINIKVVYYGPGLGGKTTNLKHIFDQTASEQKGKLISLATETDRTLFFDFMPLDLGSIQGFKTRLHLYTVPGQVFYNASRKLILKGVDGIVQVADSQFERLDANIESIENLQQNLQEHNYEIATIPYVLQLNKRDVEKPMPVDLMLKHLKIKDEPCIEAVATDGTGVFETLKTVSKMVLVDLRKRLM